MSCCKATRSEIIKLNCLLPNDEWAFASVQDLLLVVGMLLLLLLQHLDLLEALEGESDFVLVVDQLHAPETAHSKCPDALQFVQLNVTKFAFTGGCR